MRCMIEGVQDVRLLLGILRNVDVLDLVGETIKLSVSQIIQLSKKNDSPSKGGKKEKKKRKREREKEENPPQLLQRNRDLDPIGSLRSVKRDIGTTHDEKRR